jgi:cysteine desulfurase
MADDWQLFCFFQLTFFYIHIFEFAGLEDFAAFQAFHEFSVFFAGNYSYAGVLAFGQIVLHRRRLGRAGCGHRFRTIAFWGRNAPADSRRNWRIFIATMGTCQAKNEARMCVKFCLGKHMSVSVTHLTDKPAPQFTADLKLPIYLDNHSTTPIDPRVLDEMLPYLTHRFGNAASRSHSFGWAADEAVETARTQVATLIGANKDEIVFTSGATESDNLAIKGVAEAQRGKGNHIITAVTEHKAVLDSCKRLEKYGYGVTYLPVQNDGLIDLDELHSAMNDATILVTIMAANNETGVLQPIEEIGKLCRERDVIFHTDAAQAIGKIPIDVVRQNIDLLSISAHKAYGPKGMGALYVRQGVEISPTIDGGGHERGMRSGTLNVPGIVALGKACEVCGEEMPQESCRIAGLRNRLHEKIRAAVDEIYVNGSMEHRLSGNLNVSFAGVDGEELMTAIDDVAVSSGAACTSAHTEPSYVLKALGISDELAQSSIRFGIGRFNTEAEIDYVAAKVIHTVQQLRELL